MAFCDTPEMAAYVENVGSGDRIKIESAGISVGAVGADSKPGPWSDPAVKVVP